MGRHRSRTADRGAVLRLVRRTDGAEEWAHSVRWDDRSVGGGNPPTAASPQPPRVVQGRRYADHPAGRLVACSLRSPAGQGANRRSHPAHVRIWRCKGAPMRGVQELVGHLASDFISRRNLKQNHSKRECRSVANSLASPMGVCQTLTRAQFEAACSRRSC